MSQTNRPRGVAKLLRSMQRIGIILLLMVLGIGILLWSTQRRLIYPGAWTPRNLTLPRPAGVESLTMNAGGEIIEAWLIPGEGATAENPGPAVIFLHGNGEIIDMWPQELSQYARAGYTVLLPEYRGFGRSGGSPSEATILADLVRWRDTLIQRPEVDPQRLVYHGRSLGTGFSAQLARLQPPAALILGSGFTSLADAARDLIFVPRWMVRDRLEVRGVLENYAGPTLLLHGDRDDITPLTHARRNAAAAKDATLVIYPNTSHNDMPRGHGRWEDIAAFLQAHGLPWREPAATTPPDVEQVTP